MNLKTDENTNLKKHLEKNKEQQENFLLDKDTNIAKDDYRDNSISEYSKTTRDLDNNRENLFTNSNKSSSQSIHQDPSEFGKYTPLNASKNPSLFHRSEKDNEQNIKIANEKKDINFYSNYDNNSLNEFSTKTNKNFPTNFSASIKNDMYRCHFQNLNKNFNPISNNDYGYNKSMNEYTNYSIPAITQNQSYYQNFNSYEINKLKDSNYDTTNPNCQNYYQNITPRQNEVLLSCIQSTQNHKYPTTPSTSGVITSYVPQYLESVYINPSYYDKHTNQKHDYYESYNDNYNINNITSSKKTLDDLYKDREFMESFKNILKFENFNEDYISTSKRKFTNFLKEQFKITNNFEEKKFKSDKNFNISSLANKSYFCTVHHEIEDFILFEDINEYKKYDKICKNCLSALKMRKGETKLNVRPYHEVILDNKDLIDAIKSNQINIHGLNEAKRLSNEADNIANENILALADELIENYELFITQINSKLETVNEFENDELIKIKEFVDSFDFDFDITKEGEPRANLLIDRKEKNETIFKHISLATLLLNLNKDPSKNIFKFIDNKQNYNSQLSENLKNYIINILKLRKFLVTKLSFFIKFLVGNFYDFIFHLEKSNPDNTFRSLVQQDYINDEVLSKVKIFYEDELKKKDYHLLSLEEENIRMKHELEMIRTNFSCFSEQQNLVSKLKQNLSNNEEEKNTLKKSNEIIITENQRLVNQTTELINHLQLSKNEMDSLKAELENKFRIAIQQIKTEYEKNINSISIELKDARIKLSETEAKLNINLKDFLKEKDLLNNIIITNQQTFEFDMKTLKEHLDSFLRDYNNVQKNLNNHAMLLTDLNHEKDAIKIDLENLNAQVLNYKNTILAQNNIINTNAIEREDLRNQVLMTRLDNDKLKNELNQQANARDTLESMLRESNKKENEVINCLNMVKSDFNNKLIIISQMEYQIGGLNNNINSYSAANESFDRENKELKRIIDEMKIKVFQANEKDNEIDRLNEIITITREEWTKLSKSYETLLSDIKIQLSLNDNLTGLVYELQRKIDYHNNQIINYDQADRYQIEMLAKQSLQKNAIEFNSNNEAVIKTHNEMQAFKDKIRRIESQNLSRSQIFDNLDPYSNLIQTSKLRDVNELPYLPTFGNQMSISPVYVPISKPKFNADPNINLNMNKNLEGNQNTNEVQTINKNSNFKNLTKYDYICNTGKSLDLSNKSSLESSSESIVNEIEVLTKEKAQTYIIRREN